MIRAFVRIYEVVWYDSAPVKFIKEWRRTSVITPTLLIVNPYAGGGRAGLIWQRHEPDIRRLLGDLLVNITQRVEELPDVIGGAVEEGIRRVVAIGGDGTNHTVLNALMQHHNAEPLLPFVYGVIPAGTGRDFARGLGLPLKPVQAIQQLAHAHPRPIDIGHVRYDDNAAYFLNISSAGISNDVVQRVDCGPRRPWTFLHAAVTSLLHYDPEPMRIWLDDELFWDDDVYIVVVANGTTFAQGMQIAPQARVDDGLFDVVVVERMPRLEILSQLRLAYSGAHIHHPKVHIRRARHVRIQSDGRQLGMDLDGEPAQGREMVYTVRPQALTLLA